MPPSPSSRRSPSRELRSESHRRGRSVEGGSALKDKDDDLALFSELQSREREDFLVQPVDDFEDAFTTKLRHFSDHTVGVTIPARGESSDLLNADGEKNDYEWLITPPDTPLFPSLDDEPAPVDAPLRGRQRTQPISISRSSTMEKSYRSSRGSASPSRSSLSPRSGNSTSQSRSKPSSAPHSSPISNMRSPPPTRRASPSPITRSNPTPRSPSPVPRRMSTGSNASPIGPSAVKGMSPGKTARGSSSSPKIKAWEANIPGFSCDVPPNLRTSLADRPASYVRGSSPASRNGKESPSKTNRQSISPSASRSVSSLSISHDPDWFSSLSKGSVASSGDDEVDSVHSGSMGTLDQSTPRKVGPHSNSSRSLSVSRKQAKLSASAPKRSFDPIVRQMDNRKAPQNMFRPLLSSVPSTTFYSGKASSAHSIISRHSSVTTSSNTSSDLGTTLLPDPEGSYNNQGTVVVESSRALPPDVQDEVFVFDKEDDAEIGNEIHLEENDVDRGHKTVNDLDRDHKTENGPTNFGDHSPSKRPDSNYDDTAHVNEDVCEVDGPTRVCSLCGCIYGATDDMKMDMNLCRECMVKDEISHVIIPVTPSVIADESSIPSIEIPEERQELEDNRSSATICGSTSTDQPNLGEIKLCGASLSLPMVEINDLVIKSSKSTKVTDAESTGISLLLKRSGSSKGIVVQGRTLTASTISYDDLTYARDSLRSSIGHRSVSSSSSIDLSSSRQTDMRMLRQLSSKKSETENFRDEVSSQNGVSSISGITKYGNTDSEVSKEKAAASQSNEADTDSLPYFGDAVNQERESEGSQSGLKADCSTSEMAIHTVDVRSEADSVATVEGNVEELQEIIRNATDMEDLSVIAEFPCTENAILEPCGSAVECLDGCAPVSGSLVARSETEGSNKGHEDVYIPEVNEVSPDLNNTMDAHEDPSKKDIQEESMVTVETKNGSRSRSLTLDEATDTILFCSSIVHDLAYNAASIAMEKQDQEPFEEGFRPTVTIVGGPTPDRNDPRRGRIVSKRGLRLHKARPKRLDTDRKIPSSKTENDENIDESLMRNVGIPQKLDSEKPPRLESKCNCTIM